MAIPAEQVFVPATQTSWLRTLLDMAVTLGLSTTSWRAGDPERTILTIMSYAAQNADCMASGMAQGGLLDYAATGTVTIENPDGTSIVAPVSPDPSDPEQNPNGNTTYLDELCRQNYNVERIRFTFAGGPLAITNTTLATYGPFAVGEYHVTDPVNSAAYGNDAAFSLPPSAVAGTVITAVAAQFGLIKVTTSTNHTLSTGAAVTIIGVTGVTPLEDPTSWYIVVTGVKTFTLTGSLFAGSYVSGGKVYVPTVESFTADVGGSVSTSVNADGVADVHTVTQAVTSLVGVTVDNLATFDGSDTESNLELLARTRLKLQSLSSSGPRGAYEFFALSSVVYAPLLNPPLAVSVKITRVLAVEDKLTGHVYTFLANTAGAPSGDDVIAVDAVLQAYCVPLGITAETFAATEVDVAYVAEVYLPSAYATDANQALFETAVQTYFSAFPIGGASDPGNDYTEVLPFNDALGVIFETAAALSIPVANATLTLNGATADISLPVSTSAASIANLSPAVPTINFHPT